MIPLSQGVTVLWKKILASKKNKHNQTLSYWEVSYLSRGLIHRKNKPDKILAIIPKPQFHLWKTSRRSNSALKVNKKRTLLTRFMGVGQSDVPPICQLSQEFLLQCNNFQFLFTWNHFETANLLWESLKSCFSFPNQSFIWDTFLTHCSEESQYGEGPKGNTGILGPYAVGKALSCVIPTRYREKGNTFSAINIRHFIYHQIKITHK